MSVQSGGISTSPSGKCAAVTASDTVAIATGIGRGFLVATAGNYDILLADNSAVVTTYLAAGIVHPLRVERVNSTSAASTSGIVTFY
jgi:hypothetical protein